MQRTVTASWQRLADNLRDLLHPKVAVRVQSSKPVEKDARVLAAWEGEGGK